MFNVDNNIDYLSGAFGTSEITNKQKQAQPTPDVIRFKSEAEGQKDLIERHQKFLKECLSRANVNKDLASLYKDILQTRLKIVFLVDDKEGFAKGSDESAKKLIPQIDKEIAKLQMMAEQMLEKFEAVVGKDLKSRNEHMRIGECLFMLEQPVEHNKIEGLIKSTPTLHQFSSRQKMNAYDERALNQLNETKRTFVPPEASNDLQSAMKRAQQARYVREQVVMQAPPPQSHQVKQSSRQPRVPRPTQQQQQKIDPKAVAILDQAISTSSPIGSSHNEETMKFLLGAATIGGITYFIWNKFLRE